MGCSNSRNSQQDQENTLKSFEYQLRLHKKHFKQVLPVINQKAQNPSISEKELREIIGELRFPVEHTVKYFKLVFEEEGLIPKKSVKIASILLSVASKTEKSLALFEVIDPNQTYHVSMDECIQTFNQIANLSVKQIPKLAQEAFTEDLRKYLEKLEESIPRTIRSLSQELMKGKGSVSRDYFVGALEKQPLSCLLKPENLRKLLYQTSLSGPKPWH